MTRKFKRIDLKLTVHPYSDSILAEAANDLKLPLSRTLDVIIEEWYELSNRKYTPDGLKTSERQLCQVTVK
jgi:hypothetical protein